jgi:hypothetical protein
VPFLVVMEAWFGWFWVVLFAGMVWWTWDYYRRGEIEAPGADATSRRANLLPFRYRDYEDPE